MELVDTGDLKSPVAILCQFKSGLEHQKALANAKAFYFVQGNFEMKKKIEVALFDFDKTLIPRSSGTFLVEYFLKLGLISRGFALRLLFIQLGYRFGIVDIHAVMLKTIAIVDGMDRNELDAALMDIYQTKLKDMLHPEAKKQLPCIKRPEERSS